MRPIDADALEKTLGEWIRNYWTGCSRASGGDPGKVPPMVSVRLLFPRERG